MSRIAQIVTVLALAGVAGCKKTDDGRIEVNKPVVGVQKDTVTPPSLQVGSDTHTVVTPTIKVGSETSKVVTPTVKTKRP